jgi:class 3 adenylate cyclase/predicted ATPase
MTEDIKDWLESFGLRKYAQVFVENEIDFLALPLLTEDDLKELGLPIGARRKLQAAIETLTEQELRPSSTGKVQQTRTSVDAEHRQLTVMFCDLVGSTELSQQLDPEDLRDVNRAYQDTCKSAIERYGGYVAKYMGDGVLAYFGYPQAHEDDAERAVHAGLGVTDSVAKLRQELDLGVRVGIATGPVVVGDLIGEGASQESAVVGETPNLAARLQDLAIKNTLVIGPGTHALTGRRFEFEDLGTSLLKGFAEPVQAWRVIAPVAAESRFDATRRVGLTPLVGREHEIGLLLERWEQSKEGDGQVILLSGEAGIGKSRITDALRERAVGDVLVQLRYQCSPYHRNSALHPVIEHLERALLFDSGDTSETKLDKLEALLTERASDVGTVAALFASLLSIPSKERYPLTEVSPEQRKGQTLEALVTQVEGLSHHYPVLLIFEDAHWADPTSLEFLELMVSRVQALPVLVVITYRSEFAPPWTGFNHLTTLTLNRFTRSLAVALVEKVAGGKPLPDEVLGQIIEKTDGVPVFVEELTKTILESGQLTEEYDRYVAPGPLQDMTIPATLHDSLMARLDRLGTVKEVAQTASTIGREFDYHLLEAISPLSFVELHNALDQLIDAELVFRRDQSQEGSYIFKHALVQNAAYGSLLKSTRQRLHGRIAETLLDRFPEQVETKPELLAHHYNAAGLTEKAIDYWVKAGEIAITRFAITEALTHLHTGLELLITLPDTLERAKKELALQSMLGVASVVKAGAGSAEAEQAYSRARDLCQQFDDTSSMFPVLWGLWRVPMARGELQSAKGLADQLLDLAERTQDPSFLLEAHHSQWSTRFWLGELNEARQHTDVGIQLYDPEKHGTHAYIYGGHDPGLCGLFFRAWTLWLLGYPETALESNRRAFELAHQLSKQTFKNYAAIWGSLLSTLRSEPLSERDDLIRYTTSFESNRSVFGLSDQCGAHVYRGSDLVRRGELNEGIALLRKGLSLQPEAELRLRPYYLYLLAEALSEAGETNEALGLLQQAVNVLRKSDESWWESAIHRLTGEMLLVQNPGAEEQTEALFMQAINIARTQNAKSLELRAVTSLARLWRDQEKTDEARQLLAPIFNWFTEGFETTDLREAKALLDELA